MCNKLSVDYCLNWLLITTDINYIVVDKRMECVRKKKLSVYPESSIRFTVSLLVSLFRYNVALK